MLNMCVGLKLQSIIIEFKFLFIFYMGYIFLNKLNLKKNKKMLKIVIINTLCQYNLAKVLQYLIW